MVYNCFYSKIIKELMNMGKKFDDDDLKYLCNVNVLFTYMKNGMEFLINNKSELIYDFFVVYKDVYYYINMWTNYKEGKNDLHISLNNQQYNSMEEFKDNAMI